MPRLTVQTAFLIIGLLPTTLLILTLGIANGQEPGSGWQTLPTRGEPTARHEADFVALGEQLYLVGGRRLPPTDRFDPMTNSWQAMAPPPLEIHHLQVVPHAGKLWVLAALNGRYPNETPIDRVLIYDPATDRWVGGAPIPKDRRRGGAGAVIHDGKFYVIGGIVRGHQGGFVSWLDRYDPLTDEWTTLADAPHPRDHFQAAVITGKIYAAGGRQTSLETGELFTRTLSEVDVYDIASDVWRTLDAPLPTPRAGCAAAVVASKLWIAGGESGDNKLAHSEVEILDPATGQWSSGPSLQQGRHGTGIPSVGDVMYTASGSGGRGGAPELATTERLVFTLRGT